MCILICVCLYVEDADTESEQVAHKNDYDACSMGGAWGCLENHNRRRSLR